MRPSLTTPLRSLTALIAVGLSVWLAPGVHSSNHAAAQTRKDPQPIAGQREKCALRGYPVVDAHVPIWSARVGGDAVAWFAGNRTPLAVFELDPAGRSRVNTGTTEGSFRIAGYASTAALPFFARERIAIVPHHVWIEEHEPLRIVDYDSEENRIQVRIDARAPLSQPFETWTNCDRVSLEEGPRRTELPVIREARGYLAKGDRITVYDRFDESRKPVIELANSDNGIFFWGADERREFVRVRHMSHIVVYGWAELTALEKLPPGEIADQPGVLDASVPQPRYLVPARGHEVVTPREVPIRVAPGDDARVIGRIEAKTRTRVLDVHAGWASVFPANGHVVPAPDAGFWVEAALLQ